MASLKYQRILLKVGGEALAGPSGYGIEARRAQELAGKIQEVKQLGVQLAIVLGAGNIWRGVDGIAQGMDRATADQMGMLATVMNALALQDALERGGVTTRVQTAIEMRALAEPYIRLRAIRHLEKGRVVIIGAGTGNPYFTTDTAAALRAMEIHAQVLIKATKVDAVYEEDPLVNPRARKLEHISYIDALNLGVKILDATAISLCMDHQLPILVLGLWEPNSLLLAVRGEKIGTRIDESAPAPVGSLQDPLRRGAL
ncbi:MAG: UMP kinase [Chloroflexi bacterium]|nr:UMP kinase [Chloroflexota bacterium]